MENNSSLEIFPASLGFGEDPFFLSNQLHPLDFSGFSSFNCQWELPPQETACPLQTSLSLLESFPSEPICQSTEFVMPSQILCQGDFFNVWEENGGVLDEVESNQKFLLHKEDQENGLEEILIDEKKVKGSRRRKATDTLSSCSALSRETISMYFYMPITLAAKELNVGLTQLKKRCRELGIPRWPHRKLMSLNTLIKNVQEMGAVAGEEGDLKIREALQVLERQRELMEEMPEVELEDNTKKLRQAYFKANYKRRKLMGKLEWHATSPSSTVSFDSIETAASTNTTRGIL